MRHTAPRGFTLLEILVVLIIFSLIMMALVSGARFAGQALHAEERSTARSDDFPAVENFLRPLLQAGTKFKGASDTLSFVGRLPAVLAGSNLSEIRLKLSDDRLVLAWRPYIPSANAQNADNKQRQDTPAPEPDLTETELASGVANLSISYFFLPGGNQPGGWKGSAPDNGPRPDLIRIEVSVPSAVAARRHWVPLIIAPKVAAAGPAIKQ